MPNFVEKANLIGRLGACVYLGTFWIPLPWDIPMAVLAVSAFISFAMGDMLPLNPVQRETVFGIGLFVALSGASAAFGATPGISLARSVSLVPALLLALLVAFRFSTASHLRAVMSSLCLASAGVAVSSMWGYSKSLHSSPREWIQAIHSPLLVVPNDIVLLAVISPIALSVLIQGGSSFRRAFGAMALLTGIAVAVLMQSRTAWLAFCVAFLAFALACRVRQARYALAGLIVVGVIVDAATGLALATKFLNFTTTRAAMVVAAFEMWVNSPLLGQGPHTYGDLSRSYFASTRYAAASVDTQNRQLIDTSKPAIS
jgi:hypothetical protein